MALHDAVARVAGLDVRRAVRPLVVFDELHHYPKWRQFLKGYFDTYGEYSRTLVTGSARLEMKKRGKGDSLMGRYFPFRMNPLSVGELLRPVMPTADIAMPRELPENDWRALVEFGGFYGFMVRPWFRNVSNSIRKTPKWYMRDWSGIKDVGARNETMVACHLLKAVETWTDMGFGDYGLFYLRDKNKKEVDFLVAKDGEPWMLVEVKTSDVSISSALKGMQSQLGVDLALQVVAELPYEDINCFVPGKAAVVPMRTFLSQLP